MDRAYRFLKIQKEYEKQNALIKKLRKDEIKNKKELKKYEHYNSKEFDKRWDVMNELGNWFDLSCYIDDSARDSYNNLIKFNNQVFAQSACNIADYIESCNKYMTFYLENRYNFDNSMMIGSIIVYEEINKGNYDVFEMPLKKMKERYGAYKIVEKSLEECRKIKRDNVSRFEIEVEVSRRINREANQLRALYDVKKDLSFKDPSYDINNIKEHIIFDYQYVYINYDEVVSSMNNLNAFIDSIEKTDLGLEEKDNIYNNLYTDILHDKIKIEEETDETLYEKYINRTERRKLGLK